MNSPRNGRVLFCLVLILIVSGSAWAQKHAPTVTLVVDGTEAPRNTRSGFPENTGQRDQSRILPASSSLPMVRP